MTSQYLLFQLHGPLASWGEIAVGELRGSADHPTRSALLGLVAAALGISRSEEAQQLRLQRSYGVGVRVDRAGTLLIDYHSTQVPKNPSSRDQYTRREELRAGELTAILSRRSYYEDAVYTAALWVDVDDPPWSLEDLKAALLAPRFILYLGRRSCPLALPLSPQIIDVASLPEALSLYRPPALAWASPSHRSDQGQRDVLYYWEGEAAGAQTTHQRNDRLISRERWQFGRRNEHQGVILRPPLSPLKEETTS